MKTLLLVIGLFAALINVNCQTNLGNYNEIVVPTVASDMGSCWVHLWADVDHTSNATNAYTNISQTFIPKPASPSPDMPENCEFVNFTFTSFFYEDPATKTIPYTTPIRYNKDNDGNLASAFVNSTVFATDIAEMDGSQCLILPQDVIPWDQYLCSIDFGGLPLYWVAYGSRSSGPFHLAAFETGPSKWVMSANLFPEQENDYAYVNANASVPEVVGEIYSSCGSGNKNFWSMQVQITLTTTVDLNTLLGENFAYSISNGYVIIRQKNAAKLEEYISFSTPMSAIRSGSLCWTLGVTWEQALRGMTDYCDDGCDVTFIFANDPDNIFVVKTTGINTGGTRLRRSVKRRAVRRRATRAIHSNRGGY